MDFSPPSGSGIRVNPCPSVVESPDLNHGFHDQHGSIHQPPAFLLFPLFQPPPPAPASVIIRVHPWSQYECPGCHHRGGVDVADVSPAAGSAEKRPGKGERRRWVSIPIGEVWYRATGPNGTLWPYGPVPRTAPAEITSQAPRAWHGEILAPYCVQPALTATGLTLAHHVRR